MRFVFAFMIHANKVIYDNTFLNFIYAPPVLVIWGIIFWYLGNAMEAVPLVGWFFSFIGAFWKMLSSIFFTYLGWLWLISLLYLLIITVWCIDITNKYFGLRGDQEFTDAGEAGQIDLGDSYNLKRTISIIIAVWIIVANDEIIELLAKSLDLDELLGRPIWIPWSFMK